MRIQLIRMIIENFKGIQKQEVDFDQDMTTVAGRNETGKTTVADAFFYVLFGKDSNFRTKFDVIPLDNKNNQLHHLETSVELIFTIDGEEQKVKRLLTELWVKKRGAGEDKELTGTTTSLFINDAPVKLSAFNEFVSSMISEDRFKLLTSTTYFNVQMSWQERRKILTSLIENHSYEEIAGKPEFQAIKYDIIKNGMEKTADKFKYQHKEIKKNVSDIPARIDEASKNINRDAPAGMEELRAKRTEITTRIDELKVTANDHYISQGNEFRAEITKRSNEIAEYDNLVEAKNSGNDLQGKIIADLERRNRTITSEITTLNQELSTLNNKIDTNEAGKLVLRDLYVELLKEEYSPESTTCPTCEQELPENMKQEAEKRWAAETKRKLGVYQSDAGGLKELNVNLQKEVNNKNEVLKSKTDELKQVKEELESQDAPTPPPEIDTSQSPALLRLKDLKLEAETKLRNINPNIHKDAIGILQDSVEHINTQIAGFEASKKAKKRVAELEKDLVKANDLLLETEKNLALIDKLNLEYINTVEGDLNKLFDKKIKVRLFEEQINGGFRETCDVLVQNRQGALVPWQFVNTAGQINSSLQIINLLSKHLDIYCPVFIDHAESVEDIFKIDSQMILLRFIASYRELTVK